MKKIAALQGLDPLVFFLKLKEERSVSLISHQEWTIIAWDPVRTIVGNTLKTMKEIDRVHTQRKSLQKGSVPFIGGAIGYVSYDLGYEILHIQPTLKKQSRAPLICFHFYDEAVLFNAKTGEGYVIGDQKFTQKVEEILKRPIAPIAPATIHWKPKVPKSLYRKKFEKIMKGIQRGEFYELNLTYPFEATREINTRTHFAALAMKHPAECLSYIEGKGTTLLSFSPERFISVEGDSIQTFPIKGTRPRGSAPKEDKRLANELLNSEKETAELNMTVDLLRNDIGQVSRPGSVRVLAHRELTPTPSVWHTHSVIEGRLRPEISALQAFVSMFPGGSVTGCPKRRVVQEIDRNESVRRGPYCGSIVMLSDDGRLESSMIIRTIVATGKRLSLGVGGGIVADSNPDEEYQETLQKADAFLHPNWKRVFLNGKEVSLNHPKAALLDPSNPKAKGVFETMILIDGEIQHWEEHLQRLRKSALLIGMKVPSAFSRNRDATSRLREIIENINQAVPSSPRSWDLGSQVRILAMKQRMKLVCTLKDIVIGIEPLVIDPTIYEGVAVTIKRVTRSKPEAKALPYTREWAAYQSAIQEDYCDALLENEKGEIPEAAQSNIFWVKDGILCTPDVGMLSGITRSNVLALAKKFRIPIQFETPTKHILLKVDEMFLTKSTVGIVPVITINQTLIGSGKPGSLTKKLVDSIPSAAVILVPVHLLHL